MPDRRFVSIRVRFAVVSVPRGVCAESLSQLVTQSRGRLLRCGWDPAFGPYAIALNVDHSTLALLASIAPPTPSHPN